MPLGSDDFQETSVSKQAQHDTLGADVMLGAA
jgi:hypothetical protein